jgi:hypothetical protein
MEEFKTNLYRELQYGMKRYYTYQCSGGEQPTRDLRICIRPALLSAGERAAFEQVRPLGLSINLSGTPAPPNLHMTGGDVMEAGEWEWDCGESERILTKKTSRTGRQDTHSDDHLIRFKDFS